MAVTSSHQPVLWAPDRLNVLFLTTVIAALCVAVSVLGEFKSDALNLSVSGVNYQKAMKLMDRAGWQ